MLPLTLTATGASAGVGLWLSASKSSIAVEWALHRVASTAIVFPLYLDVFRAVFRITVTLITSAIILFSKDYMRQEKHFIRFHLLVISFVASMLLLIFSPNLISLLLG